MNSILLNIEGIGKANKYKLADELNNVTHGAVEGELDDAFSLTYIPHHVIVAADGKVLVNYEGFDYEKIPVD